MRYVIHNIEKELSLYVGGIPNQTTRVLQHFEVSYGEII
jgi:hypothetical protein